MNKGCPEVSHEVCLSLIMELEEKRSDNMLGRVRKAHVVTRTPSKLHAKEFEDVLQHLHRKVGEWFAELPASVKGRLLPRHAYEPAASGLNRHCRRKLQRGGAMVHLFSGRQKGQHPKGAPAVYLDLLSGHDLRGDALFSYLLELAVKGKIQFLLAGPPCRTVSTLRQRGSGSHGDGGPGVVREREGLGRFGLPNPESATAQLVEGDTLLILRTIVLAEASNEGLEATAAEGLASKSQPHVKGSWLLFFGMEHPEDPLEYLSPHQVPNAQLMPSIWKWMEVKSFVDRNGLCASRQAHKGYYVFRIPVGATASVESS